MATAGGAPGGDIVDAHIVMAARRRHVGHQRHDLGAAIDEIVDGGADDRMIEGYDRHAIEAAVRIKESGQEAEISVVLVGPASASRTGETRGHRVDTLHGTVPHRHRHR